MESFNSSSFPVLMNREGEGEDAVFSLKDGWDSKWLDTALEFDPDWEVETLSAPEFISGVCAGQNFPKMVHSKTWRHEIIPQLIPLDTDLAGYLRYDAIKQVITDHPQHGGCRQELQRGGGLHQATILSRNFSPPDWCVIWWTSTSGPGSRRSTCPASSPPGSPA